MPRGQRKPATQRSKESNSPPQESKTSAQLKKIERDGKKFAKRVGDDLARYAVEAATRMNAATEHVDLFDDLADGGRLSTPNANLEEQLRAEVAQATAEFNATKHAAELILQKEATAPA